jgi:hypothetical protein
VARASNLWSRGERVGLTSWLGLSLLEIRVLRG